MTNEQAIRRKVREINDHLYAGKPVYWDRPCTAGQNELKRFRVFRARPRAEHTPAPGCTGGAVTGGGSRSAPVESSIAWSGSSRY